MLCLLPLGVAHQPAPAPPKQSHSRGVRKKLGVCSKTFYSVSVMDAFRKILTIVIIALVFAPVGGCGTTDQQHAEQDAEGSVREFSDPASADSANTDFFLADPVSGVPVPARREDAKARERVRNNSLTGLANTFLTFRNKIAQAIELPLETSADVRRVISHLQLENEKQLIQSWFAYNALVVIETPAYIEGVESLLNEYTAEELLERLHLEKDFARQISGAEDALQRLRMEMHDDSSQLETLSQSLLDVSDKWKEPQQGALEQVGSVVMLALEHLRTFIAAAEKHTGAFRFIRDARAEAYTPADLILTLGARRILGARMSKVSAKVRAIEHPEAFQCFRWARLNLDQCIASSHNLSEDAWCAGIHGTQDVAGCWQFLLPGGSP